MKNKLAAAQQKLDGAIKAYREHVSNHPDDETRTDELRAAMEAASKAVANQRAEDDAERQLVPVRVGINRDPSATGDYSGEAYPQASRPELGGSYAQLFGAPQASQFKSFGEFAQIFHSGSHDPRFEASVMREGVGADGGYLVPEEQVAALLDASLENEIVRPRARVEPMASSSRSVGAFDRSNNSTAIAGFVGQWLGEAGTMTAQKGLLRQIKLIAKKLAILAEASNELIADGTNFEKLLREQLTGALGWYMDVEFLTGDGNQGPLGVINSPSTVEVAKESGQAAATIVYENIVKMFSRLHPASVQKAVWVANPATLPQLLTLQQKVKNVAGTENVGGSWVPVLKEDGSGNMTLLTRPVILTEKLPTLGTVGDIVLADFSQYVIGMRKELTLDKSSHLGFATDTSHYRGIIRVDGMGTWKAPFTPKNGPTLSWCVTLATRS